MDSLTRKQWRALACLKGRLLWRFWQQRDTVYRWTSLLSLVFSSLLALILGGGLSLLVGLMIPLMQPGKLGPELVQSAWLMLLGSVSLFWLLSPMLFIMKNESLTLDISRLTRYPIAAHTLHIFHTLLALLEPWALFFYPLAIGLIAVVSWKTGLVGFASMTLLVGLWVMVHIVWSRLLQDLVTLLFASRWLREWLSLGLIGLVIGLSFFPALLSERSAFEELAQLKASSPEMFLYQWPTWQRLQPLVTASRFITPTGWFVHGLSAIIEGQWAAWQQACLALVGWSVLAYMTGLNLVKRLFEEPIQLHQRNQLNAQSLSHWQIPLPFVLRVIVLKELRGYFRSLLGKLSFFLTPLLLILLRLIGLGQSEHNSDFALMLGMSAYIFMTSLFLYINYFGSDGEGFKLYLLSAVSPRKLILAKNIALMLFASAEFSLVTLLFTLLYPSSSETVLFGIGAFIALLMGVLSMGNILSLRFAAYMDLNQTQYRQSNGTPVLLALQVLSLLVAICGISLWMAQREEVSPLLLVWTLASLMCLSWWHLLPFVSRLFIHQRWHILNAVTTQE